MLTNHRVLKLLFSSQHGVISTEEDYFFLEPAATFPSSFPPEEGKFHHTISKSGLQDELMPSHKCGTKTGGKAGVIQGVAQGVERGTGRTKRLATSQEYFVETAVVTDRSMLDFHEYDTLEAYIFTLMNIVSSIPH